MTKTPPPAALATNRRQFLGAAATGSLVAAAPVLTAGGTSSAQAQTSVANPPAVTTRMLPSSQEAIPALGLGTFLVFDALPGAKRDHLREVLKLHMDAGVRVVDTSPLYGSAQYTIGQHAEALGFLDKMFIANKVWATGEFLADESHARRSLELSQRALWRASIDAMHVHSLVNVDVVLPYLRAWKKEGLIRYTAISHFENAYHEAVADLVERGNLDIVQINYSIFNRNAEKRILAAARDRGVAVFTNMPFEKARLFQVVQGRTVPEFAKDFAQNWAQFFLKWAMSHPAVTCVLAGTSSPLHAVENVGALQGPLPDEAMRRRMVQHMESLPGFDKIASVGWYPGKEQQYQGLIRRSQGLLRQRLS